MKYFTFFRSKNKYNLLHYILLLALVSSCAKFDLPPEKILKTCQNPTSITAVADANNPKKYTFTLNNGDIVYPINWQNGGAILGTSSSNTFSYTFPSDGTYNIFANFSTNCGDKLSISNTITINTTATVANSFSLTDPMVHVGLQAIAVTNDGTVIANENNLIKVWDYRNKTLLRTLSGHNASISDLVLSIDEKYLFSSSYSNTIIVYDWKTGAEVRRLLGHTNTVYSLSVSADNKYLASGSIDKTVKIWNVADGTLVRTITTDDVIYKVSISNDAKYVAACNNSNTSKCYLWDGTTGNLLTTYNTSTFYYDVALTPDGSQLWQSGYENNTSFTKVWNTATQTLNKTLNYYSTPLTMSQDGKYVSTGYYLFNTQTQSLISGNDNHFGYFANACAISANSQYIASGGGNIVLAPVSTGIKIDNGSVKHPTTIQNGYLSKDGKTIITNDLSSARAWDLTTGIEKTIIKPTSSSIFYNTGIVSNSIWLKSCGLEKYNLSTGAIEKSYININNCDKEIAISYDDKQMAIKTQSYIISLRNADTGAETKSIATGHTSSISYLSFTPDNKYLISASGDKTIKVWDASTGILVRTINHSLPQIDGATISADGKYIAITYFAKIEVYEIVTGTQTNSIILNTSNTYAITFSPDAKNIAIGSFFNKTVNIYSLSSNVLIKTKNLDYPIRNLYYNVAGTQLYVITQKDFQVLNVQ